MNMPGKTYEQPSADLLELFERARSKYRDWINETPATTVQVLVVRAPRDRAGNPKGPALKARDGRPAAMKVGRLSRASLAAFEVAARILVDGDWVEAQEPKTIEAAFHHELCHLEMNEATGCLVAVRHDINLQGFGEVLRTHGRAAVEFGHLEQFATDHTGQTWFTDAFGATIGVIEERKPCKKLGRRKVG